MLNREFYGTMDDVPVVEDGGPIRMPCMKCKALFLLEKPHKEIFLQSMFYTRKRDKTLTPALPKDFKFGRLCIGCFSKLIEWLEEK